MKDIEGVGVNFDFEKYLEARIKTKKVVEEVSSKAFLGMSEEDGHKLVDETLNKYGANKKWHPTKFRIGKNTTKAFRELSEPVKLQENDIYFIDIGPVFDNHEGDYGQTFVFGENDEYSKVISACEEVFERTARVCMEKNLTGFDLYTYAEKTANEFGYELNLKMNGHRLGDFPHAVYFKGKLGEIDFSPKKNLWILEILIKHPKHNFGAFFEDLI